MVALISLTNTTIRNGWFYFVLQGEQLLILTILFGGQCGCETEIFMYRNVYIHILIYVILYYMSSRGLWGISNRWARCFQKLKTHTIAIMCAHHPWAMVCRSNNKSPCGCSGGRSTSTLRAGKTQQYLFYFFFLLYNNKLYIFRFRFASAKCSPKNNIIISINKAAWPGQQQLAKIYINYKF